MIKNIIKEIKKFLNKSVNAIIHCINYFEKTKYYYLTAPEKDLEELLNDTRFCEHFETEYLVEGIRFKIDYRVHEDFKDFAENELYKVVDCLVNTICEKLPHEIKSLLKYKRATICLKDIKSIRQEISNISSIGTYTPEEYEIVVGACDIDSTINTLYHEIGHFIDNVIKDDNVYEKSHKKYYSEICKKTAIAFETESNLFRSYAKTSIAEYIAVGFEKYFNEPEYLSYTPQTKYVLDGYMERLRVLYCDCISN